MTKTYPTTPEIRAAKYLITELERSTEKLFKGSWFSRPTFKEKLDYVKEMAFARNNLWECVYRTYPESKGKTISVGESLITVTEEDKSPSTEV